MKIAAPETRLMISGAVGFYHIVHKDFHAGFDLFAVLIKTAIHNFYAFFGRELATESGEGERVTVKFHQISKSRRLLPSRYAANPKTHFIRFGEPLPRATFLSEEGFRWFESVYRPEKPEMHLQNFEKLQSRKI